MPQAAARSTRRQRATETFRVASETIGELVPGLAIFAVTRGQFSMIDAVLATIEQVGQCSISLWTWTIADYEIECVERLQRDGRIKDGLLVIDGGARKKNSGIISGWKALYGDRSVRYVRNHAKIATVYNDRFRVLLRGSMNLNFNPRFEQFDLTEGGPDFDLVKQIESDLPFLPDDATGDQIYKASKVNDAFDREQLEIFREVKVWAK